MNLDQMWHLIFDQIDGWTTAFIRKIPNLGVAVLVILLTSFVARLVRNILTRTLKRVSSSLALNNLTATVAVLLINATGIFIALGVLGLDKTVTSLLAGAGVVALAIGFAFQDLTTNFISGTFIAIQRPIEVGDVVETNGFQGKVIDIKLRSIVLNNFHGQEIEIPSKDVFQKPIINYSRTGGQRIEVTGGLSYLDDLTNAQQVARKAIESLDFVQNNKPIELYFKAFTLDMIQFSVWFWIDPIHTSPLMAVSEVMKVLKTAFDENGLSLMFSPNNFELKKRQSESLTPQQSE